MKPCLRTGWTGYSIRYRHGSSVYLITVGRDPDSAPEQASTVTAMDTPLPLFEVAATRHAAETIRIALDGGVQESGQIKLADAGREHKEIGRASCRERGGQYV